MMIPSRSNVIIMWSSFFSFRLMIIYSQNYKYFLVDEPNPNHKCRSEITIKGKEKKEKIMKVIMMIAHDVFTL